jgi:hypothetical protein
MDLFAPFTGTLFLPDRQPGADTSPALLQDGQPIAAIRWHGLLSRFEVLDRAGQVVAQGRQRGLYRPRYPVVRPDGQPLVEFRAGLWHRYNGAVINLPGGRQVTVRQTSRWSPRRLEFHVPDGPVGHIEPIAGSAKGSDSYAFGLALPVLSTVQAVALGQSLRVLGRGVRAARSI